MKRYQLVINVSILEFSRRLFKSGGISFKGMLLLPLYYLQIIPVIPFALLQYLLYGRRINKTAVKKDPVFILGHYRTGTTYLQKLLISDKRFGSLTNYDALFPNLNLLFGKKMQRVIQHILNALKIKNPFFNECIVQLTEPAEEDDYLMNKASVFSAYWGLVFPKRWREWLNGSQQFMDHRYYDGWKKEYYKTIKYATFKNSGKQLVLKSPPNTERVSILLEMFPKAKFIYLFRNPFHLYYSIRNMWKKAILKYYSLQKISDEELDEIIFDHLIYLTDMYERDKMQIPAGHSIEISYEELKSDSFGVIERIYSEIGLQDFEKTAHDLKHQLEVEKDYQNFHYQFCANTLEKIEEKWGKYIRRWNYSAKSI